MTCVTCVRTFGIIHKMFTSPLSHCHFSSLILTPCICTHSLPSLPPSLPPSHLPPSLTYPPSLPYLPSFPPLPTPLHIQGVTIPSQRRYVLYYGHLIRNSLLYTPKALYLKAIRLEGVPRVASGTYSKLGLCAYTELQYDY